MFSPKASKLTVRVVGRNNAIRSAVPENPTLEPNMKWIRQPVAEIWPFEIFQDGGGHHLEFAGKVGSKKRHQLAAEGRQPDGGTDVPDVSHV